MNEPQQGGAILALNPKGYGPPVLAPCPCRACAVLRARNQLVRSLFEGWREERNRNIKGTEE